MTWKKINVDPYFTTLIKAKSRCVKKKKKLHVKGKSTGQIRKKKCQEIPYQLREGFFKIFIYLERERSQAVGEGQREKQAPH